jgi:DNA processing protein
VSSAASAGCHRLLREYDAICIRHADDVLELLGRPTRGPERDARTGGDATTALHSAREGRATDDGTRVLDALSTRTTRSTQDLARRAGLDAGDVEPLLGLLALEGLAVPADGGWRRAGGRSDESTRG